MVTLEELFQSKFFIIPDYQRGYAWGEKQLVELWDDINDLEENPLGSYKPHYMGAIIYNKSKKTLPNWIHNSQLYEIVDGQQRLTTIVILLFELLKKGRDTSEGMVLGDDYCSVWKNKFIAHKKVADAQCNPHYKLEYCNKEENASLLNKVFEDSSTILNSNYQETVADVNLKYAKEFFASKIREIDDIDREKLFRKILSLSFDVRDLSQDCLDVQAIFETMNNRGKPLTTLEKLKNRLMYLTANKIVDEDLQKQLRADINTIWGNIYRCLAQNCNNILDEDEFLSAHLSLYREPKYSVFSSQEAEDKLFKMFCNHAEKYTKDYGADSHYEESVNYEKIHNYICSLDNFVKHWCYINNVPYVSELDILLHKILLLDKSKEVKIFLSTLRLKNLLNNNILVLLEKILFRGLFPALSVMDIRQLASISRDLFDGEDDDVNKRLKEILEKGTITLTIKESMISGMTRLFSYVNGKKGYYRWYNGLKYLLFEYEESITTKNDNPGLTIKDFDATSIEHIIPQTYETYWNRVMEQYISQFEVKEEKELAEKIAINTLGNLCLLKGGKNSELGNKSWKDKRERFNDGSFSEREVAKVDNWNLLEVYNRGVKLLNFICKKIDGLELTEEDIKCLLFVKETYYIDDIRNNRSSEL